MVNPKKEYHRLPGRGRKRGGLLTIARIRARLWAGNDHLLCVYNSGYTEDYKRFYYRDIQAILTRKTGRGVVWSIVFGLFTILFAALSSTAGREGAVVLWSIAGLFFALLLTNILRGPTCITHLQTAVSKEELPSLDRLRKAKRVIERLRPLIEAAQGSLGPDEMRARAAGLAGRTDAEHPAGISARNTAGARSAYRGRFHAPLFYLLLLDGMLSALGIFINNMVLSIAGSALMMAISILIIISLVKQHDSGMGKGLRSVTWSSLAYVCLMFAMSYGFLMSLFVTNPEVAQKMNDQWAMLRMMSSLSPLDKPFLMLLYIFSIVCSVPLGVAGLVLLERFRREERVRTRSHPVPALDQADRGGTEG
jgi:energy-coupling factor transporter transmembrane protein EcfT